MNTLEKFDQTLEDLSQEVEQLKDVSAAYKKIQLLTETYKEVIEHIGKSTEALTGAVEALKTQQDKVNRSLLDFEKLIGDKTDLLRKENKEFYKDLESTIKIKLDENKSQIKQLIESERSQIKQIFEIEFAKHTKELKSIMAKEADQIKQIIAEETNKQTNIFVNSLKIIKTSIWVISTITIGLGVLISLKLLL